jgi:hypothetical protein
MRRYFAELGPDNVVLRVVVASSALWCIQQFGGRWDETIKYHSTERYAGKGMVFDPDDPRRFLTQE